jgi:hypothetical protein
MIAETVIGGLLGGVLRLVPEALNWLDRKNERSHELAMQDKALEFQKLAGHQRLDEITANGQQTWNAGALESLTASVAAQGKITGIRWADAINVLVRPILALWWGVFLYTAVLVARFVLLSRGGVETAQALVLLWTPDEAAIAAGVINFFILNRVFDKVK